MGPRIKRESTIHTGVAVDNSALASSTEIDITSYSSGSVFVPSGSSLTTLTWYAAEKCGGTYHAAYDSAGSAVTQTVAADRAYPIPAALFGASAIKAIGNAAGTVIVSLKS